MFAETAIAYNFDLQMTENNDLTTEINLLKPLTTPKFTLGFNVLRGERANFRTFTITDTFGYLVTQLNRKNRYGERYCDGKIVWKNYIYPIAGRVGVHKTVRTFIELTVFGGLGGHGCEAGYGPAHDGGQADIHYGESIFPPSPKIEFTPVTPDHFQLANASVKASVDRTDRHEVAIGLAIAGIGLGEVGTVRSFGFSPDRGPSTAASPRARPRRCLEYTGETACPRAVARPPSGRPSRLSIASSSRGELQLIPPP